MSLSPCHSRREVDPEGKVYFCAHPRVVAKANLVTAEVCRICERWRQPPPPTFRAVPENPLARPSGPCAHLGEGIGLRDCLGCRGTVRVKVFACRHPSHGETTLPECATCPDFESAAGKEAGLP